MPKGPRLGPYLFAITAPTFRNARVPPSKVKLFMRCARQNDPSDSSARITLFRGLSGARNALRHVCFESIQNCTL